MGKDDYNKTVSRQYNRLLEQCKVHMDRFEKEYPEPREDFQALLKERGVSRRDFLKGRRELQPPARRVAPLRRVHGLQRGTVALFLPERG